jgi:hypothetical protein
MKYLLKHKLSSLLLVMVGMTGVALMAAPVSARALPPLPTQLMAITCPKGQTAHVEGTCCPPDAKDAGSCLYAKYLNPTINLLSALVGVAVVIGIIVGGIQFSSSAGDPQQAAKGKAHIRNALIALFAYLFFYTALQFLVPGGKLNG